MIYRRVRSLDKNLIFAEYFNSEQELRRNGGVPTDVIFDKGKVVTSVGYVDYDKRKFPSVYSIRFIFELSDMSSTTMLCGDKYTVGKYSRIQIGINGEIFLYGTTNGFARTTVTGVITTDTKYDLIITNDGTGTDNIKFYLNGVFVTGALDLTMIEDFYIGQYLARGDDLSGVAGEVELIEIYNKPLTAEEISNLSNNARYVMPNLNRTGLTKILHVDAFKGIARNLLSGDTILGELVPEVVNTDIEVVKEGSIRVPRFNGSSSKIDCGDYNDLIGDLSVIAWVNAKSLGELSLGIILDNSKFRIFVYDNSNRRFRVQNDASTDSFSGTDSVQISDYQFLVITRTAAGLVNFYVDGESNGTPDQDAGTPEAGTANILIGNVGPSNRTWDGKLPEVQVIDGLMTPAEISAYFTSTKHLYQK